MWKPLGLALAKGWKASRRVLGVVLLVAMWGTFAWFSFASDFTQKVSPSGYQAMKVPPGATVRPYASAFPDVPLKEFLAVTKGEPVMVTYRMTSARDGACAEYWAPGKSAAQAPVFLHATACRAFTTSQPTSPWNHGPFEAARVHRLPSNVLRLEAVQPASAGGASFTWIDAMALMFFGLPVLLVSALIFVACFPPQAKRLWELGKRFHEKTGQPSLALFFTVVAILMLVTLH